eukprot:TRINITY_DN9104_c1_g1_i4.p1 TRINITY_DN9104_c1_g1~~TRINITY_DN9104_c1_g1_i4.p1  ORF type:complete len:112 (+),score=9.62 TRINITY_DN9104_c1_g1_i4:100-435(+)
MLQPLAIRYSKQSLFHGVQISSVWVFRILHSQVSVAIFNDLFCPCCVDEFAVHCFNFTFQVQITEQLLKLNIEGELHHREGYSMGNEANSQNRLKLLQGQVWTNNKTKINK